MSNQQPKVDLNALPPELTTLIRWVGYKVEKNKKGESTKVPYCVISGKKASSTDPKTWCSFSIAKQALEAGKYDGIGFVLGDGVAGIDLDGCRDPETGELGWGDADASINPQEIIEKLDSYTEISPSGTGLHIIVKGVLPPGGRQKTISSQPKRKIEVFDMDRYFTVTGLKIHGNGKIPERFNELTDLYKIVFPEKAKQPNKAPQSANPYFSESELLEKALRADDGGKFRKLWNGDISGYASQSEADLAFCCKLGFWTGNDESQIDSLFRQSALYREDKWERNDYRERTIKKAIELTTETYKPRENTVRKLMVVPDIERNEDAGSAGDWRDLLDKLKNNKPKNSFLNIEIALTNAPEWLGVLGFNELSYTVVALKKPPIRDIEAGAKWTDQADRLTTLWMQQNDINASIETVGQAIQTVGRYNPFHPVRDYLDSLKWDKVVRLPSWLVRYLGVKNDPATAKYHEAVGTKFLISAVARIYQPGCKADCCPILGGAQGIGKSTVVRTLFSPAWYTDEIADLGSKDSSMQVAGVWGIELSELDSMSKPEANRTKAFMSRSVDRYRPPYGKNLVDAPRQSVFVGTVNHDTYLKDETGARRFWPIACGSINIAGVQQDRDQLWAEAVHRYKKKETWWLEDPEHLKQAADAQAERYEGDPWDEIIHAWIEGRSSVSVSEVLASCIGKPREQWSQLDKNRVSRSLRCKGWERYKSRDGNEREWRYRPLVPV